MKDLFRSMNRAKATADGAAVHAAFREDIKRARAP